MKEKAEEIEMKAEVLDKTQHKISHSGSSLHINIPKEWIKGFTAWLRDSPSDSVELLFVKDMETGEKHLVARRIKNKASDII